MEDGRGARILLVEDEPAIALGEERHLRKAGYRVLLASSGERAVELAAATAELDLVLMDLDLGPGMNGIEAARRILAARDLPLLFLSAHQGPEAVEGIEDLDFYGYVLKNSGEAVLSATIRMALRHFESKRRGSAEAAALLESEASFRALAENSGDFIMRYDREHRHVYANAGTFRVSGIPRETFLGKTHRELGFQEELCALWEREIDGVFLDGTPHQALFEWESAEGPMYLDLRLFPEFDAAGKVAYVLGVSRDFTAFKRNETRIEELLREKEIILREVHHRVKNNMNSVYGLLILQGDAQRDGKARAALHDAAGRVQGMMVLYDRLYRAEKLDAVTAADYLPALVDEILESFAPTIPVRIETKVEPIPMETGVLANLGIVVNELVTNALKHAFPGRSAGAIRVGLARAGAEAILEVEDDGIGLGRSPEAPSSGFGTQLVTMLAEQLHGRLESETPSGGGALFRIIFKPAK